MSEKVFVIRGDEITTLYSDELRELGGTLHVERVSNVEWDDVTQGWVATIPQRQEHREWCAVLGPFPTHEKALAAEVAFIQARL